VREHYYAISGKIGSGKTSIANGLTVLFNLQRRGFADAIKEAVAKAIDCPVEDVYRMKQLFRPALQIIGTETGRAYWGEDYWVHKLLEWVERAEADVPNDERDQLKIVVDDLRFPNEAAALKDFGFKLVRIEDERESHLLYCYEQGYTPEQMEHVSETALDSWTEWDIVIPGRPWLMRHVFASFLAATGLAKDINEGRYLAAAADGAGAA